MSPFDLTEYQDQACSYLSTLSFVSTALVTFVASTQSGNENVSYTNPILPGWNSDPSCVFVAERDNTFFCTTSSFLAYPGAPIHPSKDLINWKLASNVINRPEQLPTLLTDNNIQGGGIFATTLRYHSSAFYLITTYIEDPLFPHSTALSREMQLTTRHGQCLLQSRHRTSLTLASSPMMTVVLLSPT